MTPHRASPLSLVSLTVPVLLGAFVGASGALLYNTLHREPPDETAGAVPPLEPARAVPPAAPAPLPPGLRPPPAPVPAPPPPPPSVAERVASFDTNRALADLDHLAITIGRRYGGTAAERQAASYLAGELSQAGYDVSYQDGIPMPSVGRQTLNVIARHPDYSLQRPRIVLGAHMDSIDAGGGSPGANDNGSGTAVVLEAARCLATVRLPYSLEVVFYGAEEAPAEGTRGHFGSRYHAAQYRQNPVPPIDGVLNVDMIGVGERLYAVSYDDPEAMSGVENTIKRQAIRSAEALGVQLDPNRNNRFSDHEAYARQGIPHVWLYRRLDPRYHTWEDQAQYIEPHTLEVAGRLTLHILLAGEWGG